MFRNVLYNIYNVNIKVFYGKCSSTFEMQRNFGNPTVHFAVLKVWNAEVLVRFEVLEGFVAQQREGN